MGVPKLSKKFEKESNEIPESEKKRLQSLKEKKRAFKAKERAVQDALKDFDSKPKNKKIVFDEDIDQIPETQPKKKEKLELFDHDEEETEDELDWDKRAFEAEKKKPAQILGADERFKLDDRFMEEESDSIAGKDQHEDDDKSSNLEIEKQQQLGILESILGAPITSKTKDTKLIKPKKKGMVRYDPTANNHQEYEITMEKPEPVTKKVKKKKEEQKETLVNESVPVVSKEIYFSVSESLSKSFAEKEQFSLLKTFGNEQQTKIKDDAPKNVVEDKPKKFQINFDTKNPFKYDSSDDENQNEDEHKTKEEVKSTKESYGNKQNIFGTTNRFFFDSSDSRFDEAVQFFSKESVPSEEFPTLRRELKQIVRAKIRKNIQKTNPWGSKRKIKRKT